MLNAGVDPAAWADLGSGDSYGEFTFTIVPEPSTIALMSLGRLALLNRKRKHVNSQVVEK